MLPLHFKRIFALLVLLCVPLMLWAGGESARLPAFVVVFAAAATLSGPHAFLRGELGANNIAGDLNLTEVLDSALLAFKRAVLPLTMFATTFRNVQLHGTDKVAVRYYPLQGTQSRDFNYQDCYQSDGTNTEVREILINKRKYQGLSVTGYELARMPMLDLQKLGTMKGQKLAYDVVQDILSVVTPANFPSVAFTGLPSTFDSDDVVDIRTACNKNTTGVLTVPDGATTNGSATLTSATANFHASDIGALVAGAGIPALTYINAVVNTTTVTLSQLATATAANVLLVLGRPVMPWPETGRGLLVNPDYDGALLKDHVFSQAYSIGTTSAIQQGRLPNIFGFDYAQSAGIPNNGGNLVGMASYMSAILAAFSPIAPPPAVRAVMSQYEIATDPDTGISLEYRVWGTPNCDTEMRVIECNYGYAVGEQMALKRIVSA